MKRGYDAPEIHKQDTLERDRFIEAAIKTAVEELEKREKDLLRDPDDDLEGE